MTVGTARLIAGAGCLSAVLALGGCSDRSAPTAEPAVASASAYSPPDRVPWSDPTRSLKDVTAETLVSTGRRAGGLSMAEPGTRPGAVWVAIECQGKGPLTVDTGAYGRYSEKCGAVPDGTINEFESRSSVPAGRLGVTAGPGVTWSVAVGWSRHGDHEER